MKAITSNKALCIVIMIILIVAGLLLGGMWSLNARYERISAYRSTKPQIYNAEAMKYNEQLEKFPANLVSTIMPIKGTLEYDPGAASSAGYSEFMPDVSALGIIGIGVLLLIVGGVIKLLY